MTSYQSWLDWIRSQERTLLDRVKQWVAINSFSWNKEGVEQLLILIHTAFRSLGGVSRFVELSPQKVFHSHQTFHLHPLGRALVISKRPEASIQVVLGGHIDTVYPINSPFQKIEEMSPEIWKGPGVADMKGGIAILLTALEALERSPFAEKIGWEVIINPDEEIGSPGSSFLFEEAAQRHHCGLIFEPSFPDGAFVNERKGSATYTIVIKGKAAHVGRDYTKGRSAVFALARLINQIDSLRNDPDLIANVTDIEGKGPVNIVPPFASCRVNLRSSHTKSLKQASMHLYQIAKECEEEGITIEVDQHSFRLPKPFDSNTQFLFQAYAHCADILGIPFQTRPTGGVCDGNILAGAGLPTLDTAGCIGGALHTHDEYMICSSLVERAKLAALFLFKFANREFILHGK